MASMEPGHEDREYAMMDEKKNPRQIKPQWSPVMKTGNTNSARVGERTMTLPQWSPVMKTGNTRIISPSTSTL